MGLKVMLFTMPPFPWLELYAFSDEGKYYLLSLGCGKLKGLRELMRIWNTSEGEVRLDTKRMGSARFPTRLWRMVP